MTTSEEFLSLYNKTLNATDLKIPQGGLEICVKSVIGGGGSHKDYRNVLVIEDAANKKYAILNNTYIRGVHLVGARLCLTNQKDAHPGGINVLKAQVIKLKVQKKFLKKKDIV